MNTAEFCFTVSDNSLCHLGLLSGDLVLCDNRTAPARFVVATYDGSDEVHILTMLTNGDLFDEGTHQIVTDGVMVWGRALYVQRPLTQPENPQ